MSQGNLVYTTLRNSIDLRKNILETGIDTIRVLQRYENIRDIKAKKMALLNELKRCCDNVNRELGHFKKDLPSIDFKDYIKEKEKKHHVMHHKKVEHLHQIEKIEEHKAAKDPLQQELEQLRKRLESINI